MPADARPYLRHDADVLAGLVARLQGAARAYRAAGSDGPGLADAFGATAAAHDLVAETLAADLRALGVPPSDGPTPAPRDGADLAKAVTQGPRETALALERTEAGLAAAFRAAMDDAATSGPVRDAVVRAFDRVEAGRGAALKRLDTLG